MDFNFEINTKFGMILLVAQTILLLLKSFCPIFAQVDIVYVLLPIEIIAGVIVIDLVLVLFAVIYSLLS